MASAGRVLLLSKGNWASGIPYMPMDYVLYKGSSYVCKAAVSGVTGPDQDPTHWQMLAEGFDIAQAAQTLDSDPQKFPSNKAVSDALTGKVGNNDLLSLSQISAGSESTLEKKAPSAAAVKQLNESLTNKGVESGRINSAVGSGTISAIKIGNNTALISIAIQIAGTIPSGTTLATIPFVTKDTSCLWCIYDKGTARHYYGRGSTLYLNANGTVTQNITSYLYANEVLFGMFVYNY